MNAAAAGLGTSLSALPNTSGLFFFHSGGALQQAIPVSLGTVTSSCASDQVQHIGMCVGVGCRQDIGTGGGGVMWAWCGGSGPQKLTPFSGQ